MKLRCFGPKATRGLIQRWWPQAHYFVSNGDPATGVWSKNNCVFAAEAPLCTIPPPRGYSCMSAGNVVARDAVVSSLSACTRSQQPRPITLIGTRRGPVGIKAHPHRDLDVRLMNCLAQTDRPHNTTSLLPLSDRTTAAVTTSASPCSSAVPRHYSYFRLTSPASASHPPRYPLHLSPRHPRAPHSTPRRMLK